jgi:hypothetical protein
VAAIEFLVIEQLRLARRFVLPAGLDHRLAHRLNRRQLVLDSHLNLQWPRSKQRDWSGEVMSMDRPSVTPSLAAGLARNEQDTIATRIAARPPTDTPGPECYVLESCGQRARARRILRVLKPMKIELDEVELLDRRTENRSFPHTFSRALKLGFTPL